MGYRDDFYCLRNLYGYTGQIHHYPTVYFIKETPAGAFYGHITQQHGLPGNVGRMTVAGPDPSYTAHNEGWFWKHLVERTDGMAFHTSRSRLVRRKDMDAADMALCLLAIRICPLEKYITAYSRRDRATIGRQQWIRSHLITPATLAAQKQRLLSSVPQHAQIQRALARSPQVPLALQQAEWARRRRGL